MIGPAKVLLRFEVMRLVRSPMRAAAVVVFLLCGLYGIGTGEHHVDRWRQTLVELDERERSLREEALGWFSSGRTGPADQTRIDVSNPRAADRYASAHVAMTPEPLAGLALGLSDVRATWANVSAMSGAKPFQTSDPATMGNAEKLLAGNFDLAFVLAYLLPLLLLVLLFDVGSLERDLGMMRMVRVQSTSPRAWLAVRVALPVAGVSALGGALCVVGGLWTGALLLTPTSWLMFSGLVLAYSLLWGLLYGAVLSAGPGVSTAALWMVGLWLGFCVVLPAGVRQLVGQTHPTQYASELTTGLRAERYEILQTDAGELLVALHRARPELKELQPSSTRSARSTQKHLIQQLAFLEVVGRVTDQIANQEADRERAVARFGWVNPVHVLQRALCVIAGTESVSFRAHRADVLAQVRARLDALIDATWHDRPIDQGSFEQLFEHGRRRGYGKPPEPLTIVYVLGLSLIAVVAGRLLARARGRRERRTGQI